MVNKNNPTIGGQGQFRNLSLETLSLRQSQQPSSHVATGQDYVHADVIHLSAFIRDNPNPVLVFSPNGDVIRVNPAAVRLLKRLQLEATDLLPTEHLKIVQACLEGQFKEHTIELTVNHHILALTYHPMPAFEIVYLYAIEITEYRQSEAELLRIATNTIALAKRTVLQLQALRDRLPQPTIPAIRICDAERVSNQTAFTEWFAAMDGSLFDSMTVPTGEE